jgi:hypothetical protein
VPAAAVTCNALVPLPYIIPFVVNVPVPVPPCCTSRSVVRLNVDALMSCANMSLISKSPATPANTSELLVVSGLKVKRPVDSSYPKKPSFAVEPLCQRNSIPRSLVSLTVGAVSPPSVKIGSSIVTVVLSIVVVVPCTVKLPAIVTVPPAPAVSGSIIIPPVAEPIVVPLIVISSIFA